MQEENENIKKTMEKIRKFIWFLELLFIDLVSSNIKFDA